MPKILIIEDDVALCNILKRFLEKNKFEVDVSYSVFEGNNKLKKSSFDIVFTDLRLPDGDGIEILSYVKNNYPETQVVLMTSYAEVQTAVKAMKKGAFDYISKPFNPDEVLGVINNAIFEKNNANSETVNSSKNKKNLNNETDFVPGISSASKKLNEYIKLVAPTSMSVLIVGESGTGKEVIAQYIHKNSDRKHFNFIAVDCGSIPKEIAASEFFGHVKGSFTGAISNKKGHFEAADGGTLFLDEVGNLSYENQIQLLRALQERRIKPVGSNTEIDVDVRILSATNEDLQKAVSDGKFREDLYHRLNEFSIHIPSLHERKEDLFLFIEYFLAEANNSLGKDVLGLSKEVEEAFKNYAWPGNLRELKNVIKRSVLLTNSSLIPLEVIPREVLFSGNPKKEMVDFSKESNEKQLILNALKANKKLLLKKNC